MSYTKCNYGGCNEVRRRSAKRFYSFPVNDDNRCKQWIAASGNPRLLGRKIKIFGNKYIGFFKINFTEYNKEQLENMRICENHFEESSFMNETHHRLKPTAVPHHYEMESQSTSASSTLAKKVSTCFKIFFNQCVQLNLKLIF